VNVTKLAQWAPDITQLSLLRFIFSIIALVDENSVKTLHLFFLRVVSMLTVSLSEEKSL